jgi:hypothetical protein
VCHARALFWKHGCVQTSVSTQYNGCLAVTCVSSNCANTRFFPVLDEGPRVFYEVTGLLDFALARLPEQAPVFEPEHPGQAIALPLPQEARLFMKQMLALAPERRLQTMEDILNGFKYVRAAQA